MLVLPGMVDLHKHAPQYAFRGMCMDLELMDWLNSYTFPEEEKYTNLEYAEKAYGMFVDALKKGATTRACVFATRHRYATELLMQMMEEMSDSPESILQSYLSEDQLAMFKMFQEDLS